MPALPGFEIDSDKLGTGLVDSGVLELYPARYYSVGMKFASFVLLFVMLRVTPMKNDTEGVKCLRQN